MPTQEDDGSVAGKPVSRAERLRQSRVVSRAGGYAFLVPAAAVVAVVLLYPAIVEVIDSFRVDDAFVGLQNFRGIFADPVFWSSFRNNLIILINIPLGIVLALVIAGLLFKGIALRKLYRLLVFLPFVPSIAAVGIVFLYLLTIDGPVNSLLAAVGLDQLVHGWLTEPSLTMWTIMLIVLWTRVGFMVLLMTARLLSAEWELFQAAFVDGASWAKTFWHVGLPELRGPIEFCVILGLIEGFSWSFTYVYVLSGGARADSSSILEIYLYRRVFLSNLPGLAAATAVVLLLLAGCFAIIRSWRMKTEIGL